MAFAIKPAGTKKIAPATPIRPIKEHIMSKRNIINLTSASLECTLVVASIVVAIPFFLT